MNILFRVGLNDDVDRDREDAARDFYDRHGHWPDEPAPAPRPQPQGRRVAKPAAPEAPHPARRPPRGRERPPRRPG